MRKLDALLGVTAMIVAATLVACSANKEDHGKEKKLTAAETPKAVMDAANARFPGAKVEKITRETEDGAVIYDIELEHGDRDYEMDVKADGTILEIEKELDAKDRPENIMKAVAAKYPNAKVEEVLEKSLVKGKEEKVHEYEVVLKTADGKETELTLSTDGKVVEEKAGEDKKDKDDDDKKEGKEDDEKHEGKDDDDDKGEKK